MGSVEEAQTHLPHPIPLTLNVVLGTQPSLRLAFSGLPSKNSTCSARASEKGCVCGKPQFCLPTPCWLPPLTHLRRTVVLGADHDAHLARLLLNANLIDAWHAEAARLKDTTNERSAQ